MSPPTSAAASLNITTSPASHSSVTKVDLPPGPRASRGSTSQRAFPLSDSLPRRDPRAAPIDRIRAVHAIVQALDVERSARYQPTATQTFCNVYAYDVTHAAGAYLPRVWWMDKAIQQLSHGQSVPVSYDKTVRELSANSLHDWLDQWGGEFGWTRRATQDELQNQVNQGGIGVICGLRIDRGRSGHITCVLPELGEHAAARLGTSTVVAALQSQAGSKNKRYFATPWWIARHRDFADVGFWSHD